MSTGLNRTLAAVAAAGIAAVVSSCGASEGDVSSTDVQISTAIPGKGGTGKDYADIRLIIELSIDSIRENDQPAFEMTQCSRLRTGMSTPVGETSGSELDPVLGGMYVERVRDIEVDGDTATAEMTVTSAGESETSTVDLVKESGKWLIC